MMQHGQKSLFGGVRRCLCGFHIQKVGLTDGGKVELQDNLKLWYYPPQPSPLYHQAPSPDRFFTHPLLMWMPYKLWKVKVVCTNPCGGTQLTGAGLHKRARRVLDFDRIYTMVTETLTCAKCNASHVSWSQALLQQLDLAHRSEFREGAGLDRMASDLVKRYEKAGVDPPVALYVDCGCWSSANSLNFQVYLLEGLHRWNQDRTLTTEKSPLCCYTGDLLPSVNNNYEKLFGRKLAPEFCPPHVTQDMNPDSEESARLVEEHEEHDALVDEEDEGFSELSADPTVLDMEVSSSTSSMLSEAGDTSNETMAVDDQNVPGYQHVDGLAEYLVELREQISLCLTNLQADSITELWLRLDDEDKQQVVYAARHQDRLLIGRFGTPKKPSKPLVWRPQRAAC
ncbi:hypothetical protein GOODEAATRI_030909 [Goodea atripinnis]|uniref:DUF6729 domain-containing protein n=1 Tax=Goodea atripinnis TaxID=208336 RepID=A0ABV0PII1_9TELE